jgi:hypothetical protein
VTSFAHPDSLGFDCDCVTDSESDVVMQIIGGGADAVWVAAGCCRRVRWS